jgi:hypothetical protein
MDSRSGRGGEKKKNPCPCLKSNHGRRTRCLVLTLTELPRLGFLVASILSRSIYYKEGNYCQVRREIWWSGQCEVMHTHRSRNDLIQGGLAAWSENCK